jgi:AcrR family transcriptional regulator
MPRKDAVANRARVVAAATDVFAREGLDAGVGRVAREAGINVATLYRNFPSKSALILAVAEGLIAPLAVARDALLADDAPDVAGRFLAGHVARYPASRGLRDALLGAVDPDVRRELHALAAEVLAPLADRAHADGSLAEHLDVTDLLIAIRMLNAAIASAEHLDRDPLRYAALLSRGLAASPA